jgi:hypothetical protein
MVTFLERQLHTRIRPQRVQRIVHTVEKGIAEAGRNGAALSAVESSMLLSCMFF